LVINIYQGYSNALNPSNSGIRAWKYYKNPAVGDMVMEITTIGVPKYNKDRIGILKSVDRSGMREYIIETLDGREFSWTNCDFIKVPQKLWDIEGDDLF
jgi:hypothetical protein